MTGGEDSDKRSGSMYSRRKRLKVFGCILSVLNIIAGLFLIQEGISIIRIYSGSALPHNFASFLQVLPSCFPSIALVLILVFFMYVNALNSAIILEKIEHILAGKKSSLTVIRLPPWVSPKKTLWFMLIGAWLAGILTSGLFLSVPLSDSHLVVLGGIYGLAVLQTIHVIMIRNSFPDID